jgi:hypothetical protein
VNGVCGVRAKGIERRALVKAMHGPMRDNFLLSAN